MYIYTCYAEDPNPHPKPCSVSQDQAARLQHICIYIGRVIYKICIYIYIYIYIYMCVCVYTYNKYKYIYNNDCFYCFQQYFSTLDGGSM